ncbi:hypothetical protein [Shewanella gelidii]|uniref:Uncharacterized protein n=1 Tax=Shewanella gelidii TaxID=1642821 RepID=A0A917JRY8_9GAMM|nr:hypothetical protein [Shewanella gelidii]MCL1099119.1 hypothetical protein [Shewanella gelidii]GGI81634.1 hypothetical protein GCM10009332_18670 [Shewanella gelidii]
MTLDQDTSQQSILTEFFAFIRSEDFEACFHWASKELQQMGSAAYALTQQLEDSPHLKPNDFAELNAIETMLFFCASYSYARQEVEESNWYLHAETLVRSSVTALQSLPESPLNLALQKYAAIQIDICYIDRGIYTSQEWLMADATQNIKSHLQQIEQLQSQFNGLEQQLFQSHLAPEFSAYEHFSQGVAVIAQLCAIRWGDPEQLRHQMQTLRPQFSAAVAALTDDDRYIMSTDLEALWPPLTFLSEHREQNSGALIVERGSIRISYFANVNHVVSRELRQSLCDVVSQAPQSHPLYLSQWGGSGPQRNLLNDIWAGIAKDFEDIYSWQLPSLTLPFRNQGDENRQLEFEVELIYYPMGVFSLNLKAALDGTSASGVRHAMSLGTSFAMDQQMRCHGQSFGLLEEFVNDRFSKLGQSLSECFAQNEHPVPDILTFNERENRYVATILDRVVERIENETRPITARSLKSHVAYPAFVLQQRELRSAVDDWCLRTVTPEELNLNADCYNHDEFVFTNHHECVLGLLQQPNWVIEQSAEMMEVAAAINNLFHLTNKLLDKQLTTTLEQKGEQQKQSVASLEARIKRLTKEGQCLKQFTQDAHWLLELINAGSMMTFPDHTRMIHKVFQQMDFDKLHIRTQKTLNKIQARQDEIITETAKLHARIKSRNTKRLTSVLSGSMALISVGALKDIFDILNGSKLGIQVSGGLQVSIVTLFGIMLVILLINQKEDPNK